MAGRYRKIDPRIWNDSKFRELSELGKLAFLFILTHPQMTALGAMRATIEGLGKELFGANEGFREAFGKGWGEGFREALGEAISKGIVKVDEKASCVVVPNYIKYNAPESPNVIISWAPMLEYVPECQLLNQQLARIYSYVERMTPAFGEAFRKAFGEGWRHPSRNQEQEQEQEQEKKNTPLIPQGGSVSSTQPEQASARTRRTAKPKADQQPRERDELFDAIVEVCGLDLTIKGTPARVGSAAAALRKAEPPYTPEEVRRWQEYLPFIRDGFPQPHLIVQNISKIRKESNGRANPTGRAAKPIHRIDEGRDWSSIPVIKAGDPNRAGFETPNESLPFEGND